MTKRDVQIWHLWEYGPATPGAIRQTFKTYCGETNQGVFRPLGPESKVIDCWKCKLAQKRAQEETKRLRKEELRAQLQYFQLFIDDLGENDDEKA